MTARSSRRRVAPLATATAAVVSLLVVSCGDYRQNRPAPPEPRPTRTVEIASRSTDLGGGRDSAEGPEVTATADADLALVFEEPDPANARWALLYTPPFLSAISATLLPTGDETDPRPRTVFTFAVIESGRDELEFGRISLTGTALPNVAARVTVSAG